MRRPRLIACPSKGRSPLAGDAFWPGIGNRELQGQEHRPRAGSYKQEVARRARFRNALCEDLQCRARASAVRLRVHAR
ncbi:MAG: hypothetical protein EPN49_03665 [Rhodanobacter sp.]|nr:MAG: hypothetical protein EPN49_03665 [Rhodanobacter sp.]